MKYSLQILKNNNLFKRLKYSLPNALNIKYFWTLSYNYWEFLDTQLQLLGFLGITKLSNP